MPSKSDIMKAAHVGAGYKGSIADGERQRLLAAAGLSEPQRLSLNDLYIRNGERPKL